MPDREKVIKGLECCTRGDACSSDCPYFKEAPITDGRCITAVQADALALVKEQEEQTRKWLQNIADNQLSIGGVDPLTEYEQGKWDGLQMAFEILTEERQH